MITMEVRVRGADSLKRALKKVNAAVGEDAQTAALEKAGEPIIRSAKGRAPSPRIAAGIQFVNVLREGSGWKIEIGLPGGRHPWFHGRFAELGTGPRVQKSTGRRTGSMPADPFLRPAFDSEQANAQRAYFAELKRRLEAASGGGS